MTEKIDLDDLDVESDDETRNRGDWFWRDEGDPAEEPDQSGESASSTVDPTPAPDAGEGTGTATEESDAATDDDPADSPVPHVPRENKDKPVGIPMDSGGAGGESSAASASDPPDHSTTSEDGASAAGERGQSASGPHGGGVDDMTLALTYEAMKRFENPTLAVRDAKAWADWLGIVGDVEAFVINKFQRENNIDADFFSGSESPAERLADVDEHSMFYAERMVLVGLPPEESIAEQAGWEFVPLSEAAEKADWEWQPDPNEGE